MPTLETYAKRVTRSDERAFVTATSAYGPLDLQVTKGQGEEARRLKNMYFGIAGAASELPLDVVERWAVTFGRETDRPRTRKLLLDDLPQVRAFVATLRKTPQITCVAHWGFTNEWRVNNAFYEKGVLREAVPSPLMGFVPSGKWKSHASPQAYAATLNVSGAAWGKLLQAWEDLPFLAVVRQDGGAIRAIRYGLSNNEVGLLFTAGAKVKPRQGERLRTGQRFAFLEQVAPDVFYYETN